MFSIANAVSVAGESNFYQL